MDRGRQDCNPLRLYSLVLGVRGWALFLCLAGWGTGEGGAILGLTVVGLGQDKVMYKDYTHIPLRRLLAHDRLWQPLPCCSPLVPPLTGFSHTMTRGSFRLSAVFSCTPLQGSHTITGGSFRPFAVFSHTPSQVSRI